MATRVQVSLPDELLAELDQIVGQQHRSEFAAEAIREKLMRLRHIRAVRQSIGIDARADIPGWQTAEEVSAWLRDSRQRDVERLMHELTHWTES